MVEFAILKDLLVGNVSKIVLLVLDGLGGLPLHAGGGTELEVARTPNMDKLANESALGCSIPILPGVTPGSGPAHLSLFGYDPLAYTIGRGALESVGIGFELRENDLAARGNFCSLDVNGNITDRRAGRIPTEECIRMCEILQPISIPGYEVFVKPVKEHRFVLIIRGERLRQELSETDPQKLGVQPLPVESLIDEAQPTANLVNEWISNAREKLKDQHPANMVLMRGWAKHPGLPGMQEVFGLNPASIATYPMYRGIAQLVGMQQLETGDTVIDEMETLKQHFQDYDFFYVHVKKTDSYGEDGNFDKKVEIIEQVDSLLPAITGLNPDVLIITGDHSTPSLLKNHSWHPVPTLLHSNRCGIHISSGFSERECARGYLGTFYAKDLMAMILANAGRLTKFGA